MGKKVKKIKGKQNRMGILIWKNLSFNCRSKTYTFLLEHLSKEELLMRSVIDGVELLVFASKVLEEGYCGELKSLAHYQGYIVVLL